MCCDFFSFASSHVNYENKSCLSSTADTLAAPLRWAVGKGKYAVISAKGNKNASQLPLSESCYRKAAWIVVGIALTIFGTVTVIPLATALLFKAIIFCCDEEAKRNWKLASRRIAGSGYTTENISPSTDESSSLMGKNSSGKPASNPVKFARPPQYLPGTNAFLDKAPQEFVDEILAGDYTDFEKQQLIEAAGEIYMNISGKVVGDKESTQSPITKHYLNTLSIKYPHFKVIPIHDPQLIDSELKNGKIKEIANLLPEKELLESEETPYIFGSALQVNGNHRTALVVDLREGRVEFYDSKGSDGSVRKPLLQLAKCLEARYGKPFIYRHLTEGLYLQNDGYQCGMWTCKFIEERLEQGAAFNPASCEKGFSIVKYRQRVFGRAFEHVFYRNVGCRRRAAYLNGGYKKELNLNPAFQEAIKTKQFYNVHAEFYEWCNSNQKPPSRLLKICHDIEKTVV